MCVRTFLNILDYMDVYIARSEKEKNVYMCLIIYYCACVDVYVHVCLKPVYVYVPPHIPPNHCFVRMKHVLPGTNIPPFKILFCIKNRGKHFVCLFPQGQYSC